MKIITIKAATPEFPRHSEPGLIELLDGSLMIAWQEYLGGGRNAGEDDAPNRIAALTSRDGGLTWGEHRVLAETTPGDANLYGSAFLRDTNGDLLFFYYVNHVCGQGQPALASGKVRRSRDDGRTFRLPELVYSKQKYVWLNGSVKRLSTGRIIFPLDQLTGELWTKTDRWVGGAFFSDDNGKTWRDSKSRYELPMRGCMENHVEELKDGRLISVMRTQLGAVFHAFSGDGGDTWTKPQTTGLRAPESCPEINRIPSTGDLLMVWNNSEYDPKFISHYGKRTPMSVAVSRDSARTWGPAKDIEADPNVAYSNPVTLFFGKNKVLVTYWVCPYTANGLMSSAEIDLKGAIFDVEWLYG